MYESLDGSLRVELWKGELPENIVLSTHLIPELAEASLEDVTDDDIHEQQDTLRFEDFPEAENLDVLAMRITPKSGPAGVRVYGSAGKSQCETIAPMIKEDYVLALRDGTSFSFPAPQAVSPSDWTSFNYKTFIPAANVSASLCGTFKGDNRGWNTAYRAGSSRTIAAASISYDSKTVSTTRTVGKTVRTSWPQAEKTASSAGIRFIQKGATSSYVSFEIAHAVANPLCSAASPITYNAQVQIFKSGGASVYASRIQVPNHEVYAYRRSGDRKTVKQLVGKSFFCLAVNCGNFSFST